MRITKENLTRYDQHFKSWQRRRLGYGNALENWRQTEEAGVVQFYPVGGSPLEGKVKFSFKETPPASGDKSPSNPSTISGVSSVKVTRCGRNLALNRSTATLNGVTCTANGDGTYTVNGQATGGMAQFPLITAYSKLPIATGDWATVSGCPSGGAVSTYSTYLELRDKNAVWKASRYDTGGTPVPFEATEDGYLTYSILIKEGASVSNLLFKPQMEFGTVATEFEKPEYNEYTLPLGSTYYGGEIDLATGLMTVTHYGMVVTGNEAWTNFYTPGTGRMQLSFANSPYKPTANQAGICSCTHYPYIGNNADTSPHWTPYADGQICLYDSFGSLQAFKDFMAAQYAAGTPIVMTWKIAPYTVQLDPLALAALAQTNRFTPRLNTIYTDADSIQITYQKSPIRAATEQEMAILGLGGNV